MTCVFLFAPQTLRVMYPYTPQNDDELELVPGDFIFMSPVEQASASEGWVYGTSMGTGLSGLLPENYVNRADECDTWVLHGWESHFYTLTIKNGSGTEHLYLFPFLFFDRSHSFLNCTSPTVSTGAVGGPFFDGQFDGRLLEDHSSMEPHPMSVVCHSMQVRNTSFPAL